MVKENTIPSSKQTNKQTAIRSRVVSTEQSNGQLRSSSSVFFTGDRHQNASKILFLNRQNAKPEI
jgi:hypothetical protein